MHTRTVILVIVVLLVIGGGAAAVYLMTRSEDTPPPSSNSNQSTVAANTANVNSNTNGEASNTNEGGPNANLSLNKPVTLTGRVFIKGIKTPSESYGIVSDDGFEVGLGSYDSHNDEFRPYTGAQVSVTFSSVCRSGSADCCRTLFYYCGTVDTWSPVK